MKTCKMQDARSHSPVDRFVARGFKKVLLDARVGDNGGHDSGDGAGRGVNEFAWSDLTRQDDVTASHA